MSENNQVSRTLRSHVCHCMWVILLRDYNTWTDAEATIWKLRPTKYDSIRRWRFGHQMSSYVRRPAGCPALVLGCYVRRALRYDRRQYQRVPRTVVGRTGESGSLPARLTPLLLQLLLLFISFRIHSILSPICNIKSPMCTHFYFSALTSVFVAWALRLCDPRM